jgi:homoserine kinase
MSRQIVKIRVATPASIANLGPGFDCLALAVDLRNEYSLYADLRALNFGIDKEVQFQLSGPYSSTDPNLLNAATNLFAASFDFTCKYFSRRIGKTIPKFPIFIEEVVNIPPIRGLGSSSSACIAGVLAGIELSKYIFSGIDFSFVTNDLKASLAMHKDSCPDNLCACLSGGLTYSFVEEGTRAQDSLQWLHYFQQEINDPDLKIVALIPEVQLATPDARLALDAHKYDYSQVAFNISRSTCLPAIFRERKYPLLREAMKDRIHQEQRARALYRDSQRRDKFIDLNYIFEKTIEAGAYSVCISGAGSTLVALAPREVVSAVSKEFRKAFEEAAQTGWKIERIEVLSTTNIGARFETDITGNALPSLVRSWVDQADPVIPIGLDGTDSARSGADDRRIHRDEDRRSFWPRTVR